MADDKKNIWESHADVLNKILSQKMVFEGESILNVFRNSYKDLPPMDGIGIIRKPNYEELANIEPSYATTAGEPQKMDLARVLEGKIAILEADMSRLQSENARLRGENVSLTNHGRSLKHQIHMAEDQVALQGRIIEKFREHVQFLEDNIDFIVMSVHPDRHNNSTKANEVTRFFLAIREVVKKGGSIG
jgi:hypothetical protein